MVIQQFLQYLKQRQSPFLLKLHLVIAFFVILQIFISNGMAFEKNGLIRLDNISGVLTWLHIITGLCLFFLSLIFTIFCLKLRGLRYYYSYFWGDIQQIKLDIQTLLQRKLPAQTEKGLATCIQGLGLGALNLVTLSGAIWFVLWTLHSPYAYAIKECHEVTTGLIEVYVIGHGFMGLWHFIQQRRTQNP